MVWAPNAQRVSVVGDFNAWDGRRHPMRRRTSGVLEIFIPDVPLGSRYKYELIGPHGELLPLKADPFAFASERPPATASIVALPGKPTWNDEEWLAVRQAASRRDAPIAVYEVHLGSWQRAEGNRYLTYGELADKLIPYVVDLGYHAHRAHAGVGTPLRWFVGIPAGRVVRADEPLRDAGGVRGIRRAGA